ncbi:MAG: ABC transporter substrate-binding protein [Pseudomonadota bacterium]
MNRRQLLALSLVGAASTVLPSGAWASSPQRAKALVSSMVADINRVLASNPSDATLEREFERLFARYADVPTIARYTLGVDARAASPQELQAFTQAFSGYMARRYGKQFRDFTGGDIRVERARSVKNFVEVRGQAMVPGSRPISVVFLVSDNSGQDRFFNLYLEGVNLLLTARDEIQGMLDQRRGDIGQLTRDLRRLG